MCPIDQPHGLFRFCDPDLSIPAYDRAIFATPAPKRIVEEDLILHDFRTATDVARGVQGLDVQGFTYVTSTSSLTGDEILSGRNAEEVYGPEVVEWMLKLTGARRGIVHNIAFRRRKADKQVDYSFVARRGDPIDEALAKLPKEGILVNGREDNESEPARQAHIDMSLKGLRQTVRLATREIYDMARPQIEAEDLRAAGRADVKVPRYAAYSVWRPLKPVHRDPIAVLDWRSLNIAEIIGTENRIPSGITHDGDYIIEAYTGLPPSKPGTQRWYWVPEQKPNEVLIIKFADSASDEHERVAGGCLHLSPVIPGTEGEEARESVECRVYLFWD